MIGVIGEVAKLALKLFAEGRRVRAAEIVLTH
jgi:hypothetical protein